MRKSKLHRWTRSAVLCLGSAVWLAGCQAREAEPEWLALTEDEAAWEESVPQETEAPPGDEAAGAQTLREIAPPCYVHVCGAVITPGVYELPQGSHVVDAIEASGGFAADASQAALNLAQSVTDGMQVYVPTQEEAESPAQWVNGGSASESRTDKVNINTADAAGLCTLPGIGESKAAGIIAYREEHGGFSDISEIMNVPGIKDAGYAKIKERITIK